MTPPIRFERDLPRLAIRRRTLPCGLEVVIHEDHTAPQVTTSVTYRVGSSDETPDRTGFAHLFEHLFKSSAERLGGHHYDVLRRAGSSEANASTSADRTQYHETLPANQLALALWIESDRMGFFLQSVSGKQLATQQSVVRAERRQRYEDVPYGAGRFAVARALWREGHPLRNMTIGLHADIQAATLDEVAAFYRTWYVPANATLVIAGDVDADADAMIDRYFASFPASTRPVRPTPSVTSLDPAQPIREAVSDRFAALSRIHRAWHAPAAFATDEAELDVLVASWTAVGTGALWRRLVYETQLAQRVSAWMTGLRLGGELHVSVDLRTGVDPDAVRAILDDELARAITAGNPDDDQRQIDRVVTRREAGVVWSLASVSKRAAAMQRYMLYTEEPDGFAADLARYRAVTPDSLRAASARWLTAPYVEIVTTPQPGLTDPASAS